MMKQTKKIEFEPVHPKNVLLASVAHGIFCLFFLVRCVVFTHVGMHHMIVGILRSISLVLIEMENVFKCFSFLLLCKAMDSVN
jgi:hypothetical protein